MVETLIDTFEELKKYVFIIDRGTNDTIIIRFNNDNFYHLVGLHKIKNFDSYFPASMKSKDKRYKYIKKNKAKFNNILENQLKEKNLLNLRIATFANVLDLLRGHNTSLYNLKSRTPNSLYNGDFGLMKIYEKDICCLLGLKINNQKNNIIYCSPNSWMTSNRINKLVELKKPMYMKDISYIKKSIYDKEFNEELV